LYVEKAVHGAEGMVHGVKRAGSKYYIDGRRRLKEGEKLRR
jgi:hypothetical protein